MCNRKGEVSMNNTLTVVNATVAKAHDEAAIETAERTPAVSIPPQAGRLLTKLTQTTDMETALWKMMADYTKHIPSLQGNEY